jgi:two-component SAPR family response regulator
MAHVLVVDDVDVVRTAVGMILEREGHTIEVATDGREALFLVGVRPPDAVITDLWMPHFDGLGGAVAELVGIEGGVVSGVFNLESSGVDASDRRPRHDEHYHEA